MKKIELHVHLDGSVRPVTVSKILNMDINEVKKEMIVNKENKDLKEYLTKFDLPIKIMQTKENLKLVAKELAEDLKNDDVIYAEVRFAPILHTKSGLNLDEIIQSVLSGFNEVKDIKINLILCLMRGFEYKLNESVIKIAKKYLNKGVVALDLAGDEKAYKTFEYKNLFNIANEYKIPFTIHAGEADGKNSVLDAVNMGASRIGHGIRAIEDENVINLLKEKNITLEVCPTSNLDTKVVDKYEDHPIKKLNELGVLVTINTDDRTVSNITLNKEYELLRENFNFTDEDFLKFNLNAINASFILENEKNELINKIKL